MNNVQDNTNKHCSGCGACVVTCPVQAISYRLNENGFYQAFVDEYKCIKCGKCKRVCPKFFNDNELGKKLEEGIVYSAQSLDEYVLKTTTSGGIAYEISKYGIENGYKIFGTIYDYKKNIAKAIIAENMEDIELLKGSKYIQSYTEEGLKQLVKQCKENPEEKFIVFGLPCQIAGISKMIEVNNIKNEIIKIELFCHGVPSYLVWDGYRKYLKEKYKIDDLKQVNFRNKKMSWHRYYINIKSKSDKIYQKNSDTDLFYQAFFDNILLNNSCQTCEFRKNYSMADIRIGDFWGERYKDREDGVSAILILNDTGKNLIDTLNINKKIKIINKIDTNECIRAQSRKDYKFQKLREKSFIQLQEGVNLKTVIRNYRKKMPIKLKIKYAGKKISNIIPKKVREILKKAIKE